MKRKSMLMAGVLATFCLSLASANSYDITFASASQVGKVQLKAGEYRMSVSGSKATFTNVETLKTYTTDVKVVNSDTKFTETKVDTSTDAGTPVVKDIEIGGSKMKIDF